MATKEHDWRFVEKNAALPAYHCLLDLQKRVEVLEARTNEFIPLRLGLDLGTEMLESGNEDSENLRQQDEDVKRVVADPSLMDSDLLQHFQEVRGDSLGGLRSIYNLGIRHGQANSKPTAKRRDTSACQHIGSCDVNDHQVGSSADTGLLPMIVSETGSDDEPDHAAHQAVCPAPHAAAATTGLR
jgi:hypothetical protein